MIKTANVLIAAYGVITVVIFLSVIAIGVYMYPQTSTFSKEISYFLSPYYPGTRTTIPLFHLYNLTLLVFSIVLTFRIRNRSARLGSLCLSYSAIIGIILVRFPIDKPSTQLTATGIAHILLVLVMSIYIFTSLLFFGRAFKHMKHLKWLSGLSFFLAVFLITAAAITGIMAGFNIPVGTLEKIPIGSFLLWVLLVAFGLLNSDKRIRYTIIRS